MKKLALFDMDGTLFDTNMVNYASYKVAIEEQGFSLDYAIYEKYCIGRQYNDFIKDVLPNSENLYPIIHKRKKELYPKFLNEARVNYHLVNIASLMKKDYNIVLVTTASNKNVNDILNHFNLTDLFDYIITGEDVTKNKPDPECFLKAIKHFNVKTDDVVIFEDSKPGIEAASKTGASIIAINKF